LFQLNVSWFCFSSQWPFLTRHSFSNAGGFSGAWKIYKIATQKWQTSNTHCMHDDCCLKINNFKHQNKNSAFKDWLICGWCKVWLYKWHTVTIIITTVYTSLIALPIIYV